MIQGNDQQGSTAKVIVEPQNSQAGSLEDRFEGFRLQNALAMDGNSDAMSKAVTNSQMQATHGFPDVLNDLFPCVTFAHAVGEGRTGHSVAISPITIKNDRWLHNAIPP
ncbi:hypothetical protein [Candidatus Methylomirabilis sp.]|uniref:hypothetical protein n=1 Tax=Candidatus Methylomirabilis sp. TaxID=2032687 RepID=UPI0032C2495D